MGLKAKGRKRWESGEKWVSREKLGGDGNGVGIGCKRKVGEIGGKWEKRERDGKVWEGSVKGVEVLIFKTSVSIFTCSKMHHIPPPPHTSGQTLNYRQQLHLTTPPALERRSLNFTQLD